MSISDANACSHQYDTAINIVGGLQDISIIDEAIATQVASSANSTATKFNIQVRTEKSKSRIERAIKKSFLHFKNNDHYELTRAVFVSDIPPEDKNLYIFWQFALSNRLFRDITIGCFVKIYFSGRAAINKDDVVAFIQDCVTPIASSPKPWSQSTINTLATKYLNLMSKFGFLAEGRAKSFKLIKPSSSAQTLFLYLRPYFDPDQHNILNSKSMSLLFTPSEDLNKRLKKLSLKGHFDMDFSGTSLTIGLKHSYGGICDALYN
jgi:hypothetical protein